jgi:hypothetical protein
MGAGPTFAVFSATPVILAQIVERLTADRTEFCGGVVVLTAHEHVGDPVIGGRKPLPCKADLNRWTHGMRVSRE